MVLGLIGAVVLASGSLVKAIGMILLGLLLHFSHTIEQAGEYSVVTHLIEMKGFLSFLFSRIIGPGIKKDLPTAMENLIQKAERLEKT